MSQAAIPIGRTFQFWARPSVSNNNRFLLLTASPNIEHELWSMLEYYSEVEEVGLNLIQTKGLQPQSLHPEIFKSFQAFVRQAKSYYGSAKTLHYRSSSLLYYYSFLNLVKAYLLLKDPQRMMGQKVHHGLTYDPSTSNTDFPLEIIGVRQGIFPMFYEAQTSNVISTTTNPFLNIANLLSYPTEISYQYRLAGYGDPNILSSLAVAAVDRTNNQVWTVLGMPAEASLNGFLSLHTNFLHTYQEVQINQDLLSLVFGMSVPDLYSFRFFQEIATTQLLGNSGFLDQVVFRQKIINGLSPYYSPHYFDDNRDFDLVLPYTDKTNPTPLPITEPFYEVHVALLFYSYELGSNTFRHDGTQISVECVQELYFLFKGNLLDESRTEPASVSTEIYHLGTASHARKRRAPCI